MHTGKHRFTHLNHLSAAVIALAVIKNNLMVTASASQINILIKTYLKLIIASVKL